MKRIIIVFLLLCGVCCASNYYVDPAKADDTGNGETAGTAKKTIAAAIALCSATTDNVYLLAGTYDTTTQGALWFIDASAAEYTMKPDPATAPTIEITGNNNNGIVFVTVSDADGAYFEDITFKHATADKQFMKVDEDMNCDLKFTDCTFDTSSIDEGLITMTAQAGVIDRTILFTRCSYTNQAQGTPYEIDDSTSVIFEACTLIDLSESITNSTFQIIGDVELFSIRNSTVTSARDIFNLQSALMVLKNFSFWNNTVSQTVLPHDTVNYSIYFGDTDVENISIYGNTFDTAVEVSGNKTYNPIILGATYGFTNTIHHPIIRDNTFTQASIEGGIAIGLLPSVSGADVQDNEGTGFDYGIYNNTSYNALINNEMKCVNPLLLWGGSYNNVLHNTFVSYDGTAANTGRAIVSGRLVATAESTDSNAFTDTTFTDDSAWTVTNVAAGMLAIVVGSTGDLGPVYYGVVVSTDTNQVTVEEWIKCSDDSTGAPADDTYFVRVSAFAEHNVIRNNILDASDASFTMTFDYNPRSGEEDIDNNCYNIGTHFTNLDWTKEQDYFETLAAIQTKWSTFSNSFPLNDAGSISADPQFKDAANGDYTPANSELKLDDNTWIGAVQPKCKRGKLRSRYK